MPELEQKPTLTDLQNYVRSMKTERGFNTNDLVYECLLMGEEIGELYKAVRKSRPGSDIDENSTFGDIGEELADILIFTLSIANMANINLEQAFRDKEDRNKNRVWKKVS